MIVPSIDLMDGQSVQLIGGKEESRSEERTYGDPIPLAEKFRLAGEIAVIDLDRALGKGSNEETIKGLLRVARCRVGGGIRDVETAKALLDAGAEKIILGTAAKPEILSQLPKERTIAALDAYENDVVVEGWTKKTGVTILDRMKELNGLVGGYLVTFVEKEGRLQGTDMELAKKIVDAAGDAKVTFAGGITTTEEIAELHKMGADAQVGMAIYTGQMHLGDAIAAPLKSDRPDGLFPTVAADECGRVLGLAYSNYESLRTAVDRQLGVYHSRKRGIWIKGLTSGATQELREISLDCDSDTILFRIKQNGRGFCHLDRWNCFYDARGLTKLEQTVNKAKDDHQASPETAKLLKDESALISSLEEKAELLSKSSSSEEAVENAAEMLKLTFTAMAKAGVTLEQVERELDLKALKLNS